MGQSSKGALVTVGGAAAGFAVAQSFMTPAQGLEIAKWLSSEIGSVGFVAILCLGPALGFSVFGNVLQWNP